MSSYYMELLFTAIWLYSLFREFRRPLVFVVKKKVVAFTLFEKCQLGMIQISTNVSYI